MQAIRSLGPKIGRLPVPLFGTVAVAANFANNIATALPRFAPWGLAAGIAVPWFIFPALTQDFKAGLGMGITVEEQEFLRIAKAKLVLAAAKEDKTDYSATGSLTTFKTRINNSFEAPDEMDKMPTNSDEEATEAIVAAVAKHKAAHDGHDEVAEAGSVPSTKVVVDSLRSFKTSVGAEHVYVPGDMDKMPTAFGSEEEEEEEEEE